MSRAQQSHLTTGDYMATSDNTASDHHAGQHRYKTFPSLQTVLLDGAGTLAQFLLL